MDSAESSRSVFENWCVSDRTTSSLFGPAPTVIWSASVEYPSSAAGVPGTPRDGVNVTRAQAEQNLADAMVGLFERRYGADWAASLEAYDQWSEVHQINVTEPFGTVLVGIGFADYIWPLVENGTAQEMVGPSYGETRAGDGRREIVCDGGAVPSAEACLPPGSAYDPDVPY